MYVIVSFPLSLYPFQFSMLQRLRESLVLVLIAALPFHALLVTVGTKLIAGPGHAPLTILVLWKEALLALILILAFLEWLKKKEYRFAFDDTDVLIVGLVIFSVIVTSLTHGDWKLYLFGFKYDFIPLIAFFALRRVEWTEAFTRNALRVLLGIGIVVATYGFITLFLPQTFFNFLGYSDLHSLYFPDTPIAAFQNIESLGMRRMQSVMSGPNQLGLWLLIPFSVVLVRLLRGRAISYWLLAISFIGLAIVLTFSRSAWIAAAIITIVALKSMQSRKAFRRSLMYLSSIGIGLIVVVLLIKPDAIIRLSSTRGHIERPIEAVSLMREHTFGLGLGMAGPASNRVSDACVYLKEGDDPSWAAGVSNLCVFVGGEQVQPPLPSGELRSAGQPVDQACKCPLLPENWYLQIGIELGLIGFAMFITLILFVMRSLKIGKNSKEVFLAFLGISIAALFLHAWEDSAVAYTVWILAACYSPGLSGLTLISMTSSGSDAPSAS